MKWLISKGVGVTAPLVNQSTPVFVWQGEHPEELPSGERKTMFYRTKWNCDMLLIKSAQRMRETH